MNIKKIKFLIFLMAATVVSYIAWIYPRLNEVDFTIQSAVLLLVLFLSGYNLKYELYLDKVTLPAIIAGMILNVISQVSSDPKSEAVAIGYLFKHSMLGVLIGGGSLIVLHVILKRTLHTDYYGGGDIKLTAAIGSFIGSGVIFFVVIAVLIYFFFCLFRKFLIYFKWRGMHSILPSAPFYPASLILALCLSRGNLPSFLFLEIIVFLIYFAFLYTIRWQLFLPAVYETLDFDEDFDDPSRINGNWN